jgi:hypothetical protein
MLEDAIQIVVDDSKRIAETCRACGVKKTDVCIERDCETYPELVAQIVICRELKEQGLLKSRSQR